MWMFHVLDYVPKKTHEFTIYNKRTLLVICGIAPNRMRLLLWSLACVAVTLWWYQSPRSDLSLLPAALLQRISFSKLPASLPTACPKYPSMRFLPRTSRILSFCEGAHPKLKPKVMAPRTLWILGVVNTLGPLTYAHFVENGFATCNSCTRKSASACQILCIQGQNCWKFGHDFLCFDRDRRVCRADFVTVVRFFWWDMVGVFFRVLRDRRK